MMLKSAVLALLPLTTLLAQTAPAKKQPMESYRFGVQVGLAFPGTDSVKYLSDKKMGFVFGGQCTWDVVDAGQRLRARLDFTMFPQASVKTLSGTGRLEDNTVTGIAVGMDYLYFVDGKPLGFFLAGGLTLNNWKQDSSLTGATTSTNLGIAAGGGWQFNRDLSLEARLAWSRWNTNFRPESTHNLGTVNLVASYRF